MKCRTLCRTSKISIKNPYHGREPNRHLRDGARNRHHLHGGLAISIRTRVLSPTRPLLKYKFYGKISIKFLLVPDDIFIFNLWRYTVRGRSQIFKDRYEWMNSIYKRVSKWKNHKRNVIVVRWEKSKEIPDDIYSLCLIVTLWTSANEYGHSPVKMSILWPNSPWKPTGCNIMAMTNNYFKSIKSFTIDVFARKRLMLYLTCWVMDLLSVLKLWLVNCGKPSSFSFIHC